jgi:hypothetical protein
MLNRYKKPVVESDNGIIGASIPVKENKSKYNNDIETGYQDSCIIKIDTLDYIYIHGISN